MQNAKVFLTGCEWKMAFSLPARANTPPENRQERCLWPGSFIHDLMILSGFSNLVDSMILCPCALLWCVCSHSPQGACTGQHQQEHAADMGGGNTPSERLQECLSLRNAFFSLADVGLLWGTASGENRKGHGSNYHQEPPQGQLSSRLSRSGTAATAQRFNHNILTQ